MDKQLTEIIKKRLIPGVLIFNMNNKLVYSNKEAEEICLFHEKEKKQKKIIPEEIHNLYNLIKKDSTDANYIIFGNNNDFKCLYSARAFPISNPKNKNASHIMIIIEKIIEKHAADFEKIKKDFNLTKKESEVLKLVCQGISNSDISEKLSICEYTAKDHIKHLMKKMNVHTRSGLISRISLFGIFISSFFLF